MFPGNSVSAQQYEYTGTWYIHANPYAARVS